MIDSTFHTFNSDASTCPMTQSSLGPLECTIISPKLKPERSYEELQSAFASQTQELANLRLRVSTLELELENLRNLVKKSVPVANA